ncbi:hypothetical protein PTKU15_85610 [Paraburkholderia terrae]|nr:hypothetical protein PTKU15_85610 [Paraburkholderia terrae]
MIEINADVEAVIKRAILAVVATVNEDETQKLSPRASLTVRNGVLYFADIASPSTIRNLKRNPAVEINVIDIFERRGYRFKGHASILPPGDDEHSMIADWVCATNGRGYPVDHVVRIETISITPLLSPAHVVTEPARSQNGIRNTYYQRYGVKRIGEYARSTRASQEKSMRSVGIKAIGKNDFDIWLPLWKGYQRFYAVDIPERVILETWARFLDPNEPMHAALATMGEHAFGLVHSIYHDPPGQQPTTAICRACLWRPMRVAAASAARWIEHVYADAKRHGAARVH